MPGTKGMTPKLQKKMEEIMEELGMMSPRIKPVKKKDGGLMEAIEKVKAKGMKDGGDVAKPKMRPKSLKADKTEIINEEFSKKVAKQNEKAKKMEKGGEAVPSKYKGFSKLPEKVQQKINPNLASKYEYGGSVKGKGGKMMCRGQGAAIKGGGFSIR
jgi:hypothetical protein